MTLREKLMQIQKEVRPECLQPVQKVYFIHLRSCLKLKFIYPAVTGGCWGTSPP